MKYMFSRPTDPEKVFSSNILSPTEANTLAMTHSSSEACYGPTNPTPDSQAKAGVRRFGSVIGLNPEKERYYRELHANVWPGVLERIKKSNMRNFSIYTTAIEGKKYLFSYFEYAGANYEADMKAIAEDPETLRWWKETDPCQIPLPSRDEGAHWSSMEMVFLGE